MGDPKQMLITGWLRKADHGIRSAERLMQPEPILDTAVYHCQQAVEKALKGYLASRDDPIQKTHDLTVLIGRCMDFDNRFSTLSEACETLTPFGTAVRYPGSEALPRAEDAFSALVVAREALAMVRGIIGENG